MSAPEPPERLANDIVVLERATTAHLAGLHAAIVASHRELQRWMDWVGEEPQTIETTRDWLDDRPKAWDDREEFGFTMLDSHTGEVIGNCALMTRRGPGTLEIGYWVRSDRSGAGVATAAATLLTEAGLDVEGIETIEIDHDAANHASARVPEKLGYAEVTGQVADTDNAAESVVDMVWQITRAMRL